MLTTFSSGLWASFAWAKAPSPSGPLLAAHQQTHSCWNWFPLVVVATVASSKSERITHRTWILCTRKAGCRYLWEQDRDGMEAEVPDTSSGFGTLLRADSLTRCAQGGSTQSERQACQCLTPTWIGGSSHRCGAHGLSNRHLGSVFQREGKEGTTQPWPVCRRRKIPPWPWQRSSTSI